MSSEMPECTIGTEKLLEMHETLNEFRKRNVFCDVTIKVKDEDIQAHGGVLSAHSPYFKEKLREMKGEKLIEIKDLEPEVVRNCIEFMYTGDIKVTLENLNNIAEAAKVLGLSEVGGMCEKALKNDIDIYSSMAIRRIGFRYGWNEVVKEAELFMIKNFTKLLLSDVFVFYSKEEFTWLLANKCLGHHLEEMQVWASVIKWTQHNLREREGYFFEMLQLVTLDNLSVAFMNDSIRREQLVMRSQECMKYLLQHLFSRLTTNGMTDSNWPELG